MNLADLQATLRHFAAERDWQPFHTPKNLSTALMVEAAELAEVFQWMTPEESREAHLAPASKQRIGEEVADVLLYLLQVADHCQIDVGAAVGDKLARNALKYPPKRTIERVSPADSAPPDTHILLDYENVQPTEVELRAMVPDATKVWVFHGPHQKQVEQRFASFGTGMTPVLISKTGKNALDFHLSFYMGYFASRHQQAKFVVVANDKGYEPMLEHVKGLGFAVRQQGHARASQPSRERPPVVKASLPAKPPAKKPAAKKVPATKAAAKKASPAKTPATKKVAAKKAPAKKVAVKVVAKVAKATLAPKVAKSTPAVASAAPAKSAGLAPGSPAFLQKMTDSLKKMGNKRPVRQASLRRALKPLLGTVASDASIEVALNNLVAQGVVAVGPTGAVSYPKFAPASGATAASS